MTPVLDGLVAQWRRCGGEKCRIRNCGRCARYRAWCRANDKAADR